MNNKKIFGRVEITPSWFEKAYGLIDPNPFETEIDILVEHRLKKNKILCDHFPRLPIGNKNIEAYYPILLYDRRLVMARAFGVVEPTWDMATASFRIDKHVGPWAELKTPKQVAKIQVPDWYSNELVRRMLSKWECVSKMSSYPIQKRNVEWLEFDWTNPYTSRTYTFSVFGNFIDLGHFLCGSTDFFTMLAADRDLAEAMMSKCFELTISYNEFIRKIYGRKLEAICTLGGDNSCNLSPDMYRDYVMRYDEMLTNRFPGLPCNLHSCGPSSHLYDVWGTYENKKDIVLMQTRGIPWQLRRLRKSLPDTFLQITVHQPQFDFEGEQPENIRRLVALFAREADWLNLELVVIVNYPGPDVDRNIGAFYNAIDEMNTLPKNL